MAKSAAERKAAQRQRVKQRGGSRDDLVLTDKEDAALEKNRRRRNPGHRPYSRTEYIGLLILCDNERLDRQEAGLGVCQRCGNALPVGCGGDFRGEGACWFTRAFRVLNLTVVTGHANLQGE